MSSDLQQQNTRLQEVVSAYGRVLPEMNVAILASQQCSHCPGCRCSKRITTAEASARGGSSYEAVIGTGTRGGSVSNNGYHSLDADNIGLIQQFCTSIQASLHTLKQMQLEKDELTRMNRNYQTRIVELTSQCSDKQLLCDRLCESLQLSVLSISELGKENNILKGANYGSTLWKSTNADLCAAQSLNSHFSGALLASMSTLHALKAENDIVKERLYGLTESRNVILSELKNQHVLNGYLCDSVQNSVSAVASLKREVFALTEKLKETEANFKIVVHENVLAPAQLTGATAELRQGQRFGDACCEAIQDSLLVIRQLQIQNLSAAEEYKLLTDDVRNLHSLVGKKQDIIDEQGRSLISSAETTGRLENELTAIFSELGSTRQKLDSLERQVSLLTGDYSDMRDLVSTKTAMLLKAEEAIGELKLQHRDLCSNLGILRWFDTSEGPVLRIEEDISQLLRGLVAGASVLQQYFRLSGDCNIDSLVLSGACRTVCKGIAEKVLFLESKFECLCSSRHRLSISSTLHNLPADDYVKSVITLEYLVQEYIGTRGFKRSSPSPHPSPAKPTGAAASTTKVSMMGDIGGRVSPPPTSNSTTPIKPLVSPRRIVSTSVDNSPRQETLPSKEEASIGRFYDVTLPPKTSGHQRKYINADIHSEAATKTERPILDERKPKILHSRDSFTTPEIILGLLLLLVFLTFLAFLEIILVG
jgi:hypothetical protein